MKFRSILALALALLMAFAMVACNKDGNTPADTTPSTAGTTPAPVEDDTTPTLDTTTEAPAKDTTTAPYEGGTTAPAAADTTPADTTPVTPLAPIDYEDLSDDEKRALRNVMPDKLPDGAEFEIVSRTMCFDRGAEEYFIQGNSAGGVSFVDAENGAIYGQAVKIVAQADAGGKRAEIEVAPFEDVITEGCKGILFYVDFSNVEPAADVETKMCASVTINVNDIRAQGPENTKGSGIGYYYTGSEWVQTSNITACRMEIPLNFQGWIYIPASSYYDKKAGAGLGEVFGDIFVNNMRCYTDGYTYSADRYIIFDEITFVK